MRSAKELNKKTFAAATIIGISAIVLGASLFLLLRNAKPSEFVTVGNGKFTLADRPYYFVGANFWQGMNLAVNGPSGDRPRLVAELDRLQALGVTNLRIMASSEGPNNEPYRMTPAL